MFTLPLNVNLRECVQMPFILIVYTVYENTLSCAVVGGGVETNVALLCIAKLA